MTVPIPPRHVNADLPTPISPADRARFRTVLRPVADRHGDALRAQVEQVTLTHPAHVAAARVLLALADGKTADIEDWRPLLAAAHAGHENGPGGAEGHLRPAAVLRVVTHLVAALAASLADDDGTDRAAVDDADQSTLGGWSR